MKKSIIVLPLLATLLLTGCSTEKLVPIGSPLEVKVNSASSSTKGVLDMTVQGVESRPLAEVPELDFGSEHADGTLFLMHFNAKVVDGNYESGDTFTLGSKQWQAEGTDSIATVERGFGAAIDGVPGCSILTDELTAALASGKEIEVCQMFVAPSSSAEISEIQYDRPMFSRRGADKGWRWTSEDVK